MIGIVCLATISVGITAASYFYGFTLSESFLDFFIFVFVFLLAVIALGVSVRQMNIVARAWPAAIPPLTDDQAIIEQN